MAELWLIKVGSALHPDGPESQAVFDKMPGGKPLLADVKQKRSAKHLRLWFAICNRIANALDRDDIDGEAVSDFLKKATGHYTTLHTKTQGDIIRLDSISFAKLDQLGFNDFFEKAIRFSYLEWGIPPDVFSDLLEQHNADRR